MAVSGAREGVGVCRGGVSAWGCLPRSVCVCVCVCLPRECLSRGMGVYVCLGSVCPGGWVCLSGGVYPSMQWDRHHRRPPWREFLTHACKNITFPQLLRTVNTKGTRHPLKPLNPPMSSVKYLRFSLEITRMHSRRMRTVDRGSHVYPSMHWTGGCIPPCTRQGVSGYGGVCLGGVCPGGCLPGGGTSAQGGVCPGGGCMPRSRCLPRGLCVTPPAPRQGGVCPWAVCPGGGCLPRGLCVSQHALR